MHEIPNDVLHKILARSAQDPDFRRLLLRSPRAAVQEMTITPLPQELRIKFVEKDPDVDAMIVLPDVLAEEGELTEDDVADVAGGTDWGCQDVSTT